MTISITPAESVDRYVLYFLKRTHGLFLLPRRRSLMPLSTQPFNGRDFRLGRCLKLYLPQAEQT